MPVRVVADDAFAKPDDLIEAERVFEIPLNFRPAQLWIAIRVK